MNECDVCGPHNGKHHRVKSGDGWLTYWINLCEYHYIYG